MPFFIDTHAHLYLPEFDQDREEVVEHALQSGVKKIFLPNIDSTSIKRMNDMASRFPDVCFPLMGLHPTSVKEDYEKELSVVSEELKKGKYHAIGETGIDLYWDKTYLQEQIKAFREQTELALQYNLPIIIHARESFGEILNILKSYKNTGLKGIFHAFTGDAETAEMIIEMGLKMGIGGILTYKKSTLPEIIKTYDLKHFVLETDSPYLAPVPMRGKRNESSYISHIASAIAEIKKMQTDEVAKITSTTAMSLFDL